MVGRHSGADRHRRAKSQGKTWIARQLLLSEPLRQRLRSGDLEEDATTRLVWIGPVPPEDSIRRTRSIYPARPPT